MTRTAINLNNPEAHELFASHEKGLRESKFPYAHIVSVDRNQFAINLSEDLPLYVLPEDYMPETRIQFEGRNMSYYQIERYIEQNYPDLLDITTEEGNLVLHNTYHHEEDRKELRVEEVIRIPLDVWQQVETKDY